jgi:hypothetical protein
MSSVGDRSCVQSAINAAPWGLALLMLVPLGVSLVQRLDEQPLERLDEQSEAKRKRAVGPPLRMMRVRLPFRGDICYEIPPPYVPPLRVRVEASLEVTFNDGGQDERITMADLPRTLRRSSDPFTPGTARPVFVDFAESVTWNDVLEAIDVIRGFAIEEHKGRQIAFAIRGNYWTVF